MSVTFGMMDNAYFIGKTEIIKWINETLKMNITRVEQACTGAIYCQLIDCIFPNKVKMNKVNWKAKLETEFLNNLKIMQQALISCKIQKEIDIQRLAKGRYQDNFEILQWFKGIFDNINPDLSNYDAIKRRNNQVLTYLNVNVNQNKINMKGKLPLKIKHNNNVKSLAKDLNLSTINTLSKNITSSTIRSEPSFCSESNINEENNSLQTEQFMHNSFNKENLMNDGVQTDLNNENIKKNDCNEKIEQLNKEIENMKHENEKFEKENQTIKLLLAEVGQEKEFYYSKLKDIEFLIEKIKNYDNIDKSKLINFLEKILFTQYTCEVLINENNQIEIKEFIN
jgi:hypothetical protein